MKNIELDVLKILQANHQTRISEIARKLKSSSSSIRQVIKHLEREIIQDYTIVINPDHLGDHRAIILRLKTNPRELKIAQVLQEQSSCQALFGITGEYSLLGIFHFYTSQQFNELIETIEPLLSTTTSKRYQVTDLMSTYKSQGVPVFPIKSKVVFSLDLLDLQLLRLLQSQGSHRISTTKLAKSLGTPQPTIYRRIKKLYQSNTIIRFSVSLRMTVFPIHAYLQIKVHPHYLDLAIKDLVSHDRLIDLYRTSEEYALLAHVGMQSIQELNSFLVSLYTQNPAIADTQTTFLLSTFKHQALPIPEFLVR